MKTNLITSLAFLVLGTLSLATATAADGFLEIKVRGTKIDKFPNYVEVITSNPRGAAAELFAAGGRDLSEHPRVKNRFTVFHHGVLHIFHTIDDYKKMLRGHSFKDGDVVYKYFLDSEADEKSFAERYGLRVVTTDARLGSLPVVLYSTKRGFYVIATGKRAGVASTAGSNSGTAVTPQPIVDIAKRVSVSETEPTDTGEHTDEREPD